MVRRTLRPCLSQPCAARVVSGRCPKHSSQKQHNDNHSGHRAAARLFYASRLWRATSAAFLAEHPLCQRCLEQKPARYTPSRETDHRVPMSRGGAPLDWQNLQALCKSCHSAKTRRENLDP